MSWHSLRSAVQSYTKSKKMSKKQGLKWNGNAVVDFLNIYEKYEILWDTNNENYLKKNARERSFKRLYEELKHAGPKLQIPDEEALKRKIKSIKDCYRIELNKIKNSRKSRCGTDDVYKPKLVWFNRAVACPASAHASRINRFMTFRCPFSILAVFATFKILINRLL